MTQHAGMLAARKYRVECSYGCCREGGPKRLQRHANRARERRAWRREVWG